MRSEPVSPKPRGNTVLTFDDNMSPVKPYLIEALYRWISDNNLTPLVVADAGVKGVKVPESAIEEGKVVLNISMTATQGLVMEDDVISFSARFSGRPYLVVIPMAAVTAIYARENSQGMMFDVDPDITDEDHSDDSDKPAAKQQEAKKNKKNVHLKLVD